MNADLETHAGDDSESATEQLHTFTKEVMQSYFEVVQQETARDGAAAHQ